MTYRRPSGLRSQFASCSSLPPVSVGASRIPHAITCLWFWMWAVVGATAALGLISLGPLALWSPRSWPQSRWPRIPSVRRSALGLLAGAGFRPLFVAYVQREGPGTHLLAHRNGERMR